MAYQISLEKMPEKADIAESREDEDVSDRVKERARAALEISKGLKIPICDVIEAICQPEIREEVMDLCEKSVTQEIDLSQRTFH